MSHFAKVLNGKVVKVIVAEPEFMASFVDSSPGNWIQTSYDGSIRKNYAGIGFSYDSDRDAFIPLKPYDSWILDDASCQWKAPIDYPSDGQPYEWDEASVSWKLKA